METEFLPQKNAKIQVSQKSSKSLPPGGKSEASKGEEKTDEDKAIIFNEFFVSVVTDEDYAFFQPPPPGDVCTEKVKLTLEKLK